MPRLSDRAFHIVKTEIERRYTDDPTDQIERVILLSRLEALRTQKGAPMTRVQIWEILSDVAPNFDENVLMDAESVEADSPVLGASIGVGAVAVLVATAVGMDALSPIPSLESLAADSPKVINEAGQGSPAQLSDKAAAIDQGLRTNAETVSSTTTTGEPPRTSQHPKATEKQRDKANASDSDAVEPQDEASESRSYRDRFLALLNFGAEKLKATKPNELETAKHLGWQAALRSQSPPYSAQYWSETAQIWERAIAHLQKVSPSSSDYKQAQVKEAEYRLNLEEIRSRQARAKQPLEVASAASITEPAPNSKATPQFSDSQLSDSQTSNESAASNPPLNETEATEPATAQKATEDPIEVAREYGWQAAVASQNAPHPPEKWADISRLWQRALSTLNQVQPNHPRYAEAQQVKVLYRDNLSAIRDRYQREQTATQSLQSLQASLAELNNSLTPDAVKYGRMEAILEKLKTIPTGTEAYMQAQLLIADTTAAMSAIAATPNP